MSHDIVSHFHGDRKQFVSTKISARFLSLISIFTVTYQEMPDTRSGFS